MGKKKAKHGRKFNQKMKPYLVYDFLLRNTDEDHVVDASDIIAYLKDLGITAERRSIYSDIAEMNKILYLLDVRDSEEESFTDPENMTKIGKVDKLFNSKNKEDFEYLKNIKYDKNKMGFYVDTRKYDTDDIRLICECIYNSRSITEHKAQNLVEIMKQFISVYEADEIRHNELVTDRIRTLNKNTLYNLSSIRMAMSTSVYGEKHTPEKISFLYLKHSIKNLEELTERKKGSRYIVSPYKIIINDGYYYLLAFDDHFQRMRTYRIDRMNKVKCLGEERDGKEEFEKIDLKEYVLRTFSMFTGEKKRVKIQFTNDLLDTVVDRFGIGTNNIYKEIDKNHFCISTKVEVSNQFFGWICGFKKKAIILEPREVVDSFVEFINGIKEKY